MLTTSDKNYRGRGFTFACLDEETVDERTQHLESTAISQMEKILQLQKQLADKDCELKQREYKLRQKEIQYDCLLKQMEEVKSKFMVTCINTPIVKITGHITDHTNNIIQTVNTHVFDRHSYESRLQTIVFISTKPNDVLKNSLYGMLTKLILRTYKNDNHIQRWCVIDDNQVYHELDPNFLTRVLYLIKYSKSRNVFDELEILDLFKLTQYQQIMADVYAYVVNDLKEILK